MSTARRHNPNRWRRLYVGVSVDRRSPCSGHAVAVAIVAISGGYGRKRR